MIKIQCPACIWEGDEKQLILDEVTNRLVCPTCYVPYTNSWIRWVLPLDEDTNASTD